LPVTTGKLSKNYLSREALSIVAAPSLWMIEAMSIYLSLGRLAVYQEFPDIRVEFPDPMLSEMSWLSARVKIELRIARIFCVCSP